MLTIQRRHTRECRVLKNLPVNELKRCNCPAVLTGVDTFGRYHNREALHTRDLSAAYAQLRRVEAGESPNPPHAEVTIEEAWRRVKSILVTQTGVKPQSIQSNQGQVERQMLAFMRHRGVRLLSGVTTAVLDEWIGTWELAATTRLVRIDCLRQFFRIALSRQMIPENPALLLMRPKVNRYGQTEPFDLESEDPKILAALPHWEKSLASAGPRRSLFARRSKATAAAVLLMRYTGLRVGDALMFDPRKLRSMTVEGQRAYCYFAPQIKTEQLVFVPLPEEVGDEIANVEWMTKEHAFWDGKTPLPAWRSRFNSEFLKVLERASGVADIHAHRFRDTFAVDLLSKGVDIRSVSRLLGHKDVATTLRYYERYVPADQERLVRAVLKARQKPNVVEIRHGTAG